ncbi:MAG: response regulator transcription factor [Chloroflexi bacterium]|nr:response regulator transcription factor [Chloroflexota bacterium]
MAGKRILVVDDDVKTAELVKMYLDRDGYRVLVTHDGIEAVRLARESHPDLIVLDLMLPGADGLQVCRTLRNESDVPIVMLTARTTDQDKLAGLDLGADDYVTKPFSPRELAARVRAVLRRRPGAQPGGPLQLKYGDLTVSFMRREALLGDRRLDLTPTEFSILWALAKEPGRVFTRAHLIEEAIGYDFGGFDRTIDVHIFNLRKKLEPGPNSPRLIETVYGGGYKFARGDR